MVFIGTQLSIREIEKNIDEETKIELMKKISDISKTPVIITDRFDMFLEGIFFLKETNLEAIKEYVRETGKKIHYASEKKSMNDFEAITQLKGYNISDTIKSINDVDIYFIINFKYNKFYKVLFFSDPIIEPIANEILDTIFYLLNEFNLRKNNE